jgi:hypothetical protein
LLSAFVLPLFCFVSRGHLHTRETCDARVFSRNRRGPSACRRRSGWCSSHPPQPRHFLLFLSFQVYRSQSSVDADLSSIHPPRPSVAVHPPRVPLLTSPFGLVPVLRGIWLYSLYLSLLTDRPTE